jgi:hypothetical protein
MNTLNHKAQSGVWMAFYLLSISLLSLTSCGKDKDPDPIPPSAAELMAGNSSKIWGIEKLYINDTLIALDADQLRYTKTYKRDSTYVDSDGLSGRWNLSNNNVNLTEIVEQGGQGTLKYQVETLNASTLRLRLINDGTNILNTLYELRAK